MRRRFCRRSDDGAAAVEFALLLVVSMPLAFGTISMGLAFSQKINLTQAVREASRYGSTLSFSAPVAAGGETPTQAWLRYVDNALINAAGAQNDPTGGYTLRCVAYVQTDDSGGITSASQYRKNGINGTSSGQCPDVNIPAGAPPLKSTDYVQVVLAQDSKIFMVFASPTLRLSSVSSSPYEGTPP